jgi:hypothetical protein
MAVLDKEGADEILGGGELTIGEQGGGRDDLGGQGFSVATCAAAAAASGALPVIP